MAAKLGCGRSMSVSQTTLRSLAGGVMRAIWWENGPPYCSGVAGAGVVGRSGMGWGTPVSLDSSPPGHGHRVCGKCQAMWPTALLRGGADLSARGRARDTR
jgi:hypothetical protein